MFNFKQKSTVIDYLGVYANQECYIQFTSHAVFCLLSCVLMEADCNEKITSTCSTQRHGCLFCVPII